MTPPGQAPNDAVAKTLAKFKGDPEGLKAFAKKKGVWQERYETMNPGMVRMNVGNRLRALA